MKVSLKKQQGFTIIELLIVIVVIGILAALVLNAFGNIQERARDTERRSDINGLHAQLELFYQDTGAYPIGTAAPTAPTEAELIAAFEDSTASNLSTELLVDPNEGAINTGNDYTYAPVADGSSYDLSTTLEVDEDPLVNPDVFSRDSLNN